MSAHAVTHTNQIANRVVVDTRTNAPAGLTGAQGMAWLRAKERIERQLQAVVYAATRNLQVSRDVPKGWRQWLYDLRTRTNVSRDFNRLVELLANCGANVPRSEAWRTFSEILELQRELASIAFGPMSPGPEGRTPDEEESFARATSLTYRGRGVVLGSCDAHGWYERLDAA